MLRSLQHPVNSHFCTYTHLLPGVVDTFSHTHTVRDTLVGSCTISEEEEEDTSMHVFSTIDCLSETCEKANNFANPVSWGWCTCYASTTNLRSLQWMRHQLTYARWARSLWSCAVPYCAQRHHMIWLRIADDYWLFVSWCCVLCSIVIP